MQRGYQTTRDQHRYTRDNACYRQSFGTCTPLAYSAGVRTFASAKILILLFALNVWGQRQANNFIAVSFAVDGSPARCDGLRVELTLSGKNIKPEQTDWGFKVPQAFSRPAGRWRDDQRVDISLTCSGHTLIFRNQHPAFVQQGSWELGIANPLYAVEEYGHTHAFDRGTWLGYLIFEGEPGVVTFASQSDPPPGLSDALQKEQPNASPERLRDISYVLAVLNVEYHKNRDYLLSTLQSCFVKSNQFSEDDSCDADLVKFVTNLYWRGDSALLEPLLQLQIPDSRPDLSGPIGSFYGDLLHARGGVLLSAMKELPAEKQQLVCRLAKSDSSLNVSEWERIEAFLQAAKQAAAVRCLSALRKD